MLFLISIFLKDNILLKESNKNSQAEGESLSISQSGHILQNNKLTDNNQTEIVDISSLAVHPRTTWSPKDRI